MRKNGSRLISLRQYRLTDMLIFGAILIVYDLLAHYALIAMPEGANFTFTLTVPIVLLIMMRWGWWSVFFAVGDGLMISLVNNTTVWQSYVSYIIGNSFIMLLLIAIKFMGKQKIAGKWYFSAVFVILAWGLMNLGITSLQAICGYSFALSAAYNFGFGTTGLMSLAAALVIILVMRRLEGMFEDQVQYLKRLDKERKDMEKRDEYGDEPIEIDEDTLSILRKRDEELE